MGIVVTLDYEPFMELALQEAKNAAQSGEVPVGAVLIREDGTILAKNHNRREQDHDPSAHAEMLVIREASQKLSRWRLSGTTLLVTLEPCIMCAGAIILSRIDCVVFATADPKGGAVRSLYQILEDTRLNHRVEVREGIGQESAQLLLRNFFRARRHNKD
ncbi:MAG: tRNA adenosine(34) deaminase TadA [Firmicutes bacterium]|jgi:tRNA(adenine34) deaminase|nr:tRNA adenosine(34) deaminase TadA [Bacillota bacterium]MCL5012776.1 tRNA adenosine(34) deaminase TadA [Bacillota bacterium]